MRLQNFPENGPGEIARDGGHVTQHPDFDGLASAKFRRRDFKVAGQHDNNPNSRSGLRAVEREGIHFGPDKAQIVRSIRPGKLIKQAEFPVNQHRRPGSEGSGKCADSSAMGFQESRNATI